MGRFIELPVRHPKFYKRAGLTPGTAVKTADGLWEITQECSSRSGVVYTLEPWQDKNVIRILVEWNDSIQQSFLESIKKDREVTKKSLMLYLLLGMLPASKQKQLTDKFIFDPVMASFLNAFLLFVVFTPIFIVFLFGDRNVFTILLKIFFGYLATESMIRCMVIFLLREPAGSGLIVFFTQFQLTSRDEKDYRDDVITRGDQVSITTHYPKTHWESAGGIRYEGKSYALFMHRQTEYYTIYTFKNCEHNPKFPVFTPDSETKRNIKGQNSFVFAAFWGYLPGQLQHHLATFGRYDPNQFTLVSILILAVTALPIFCWDIHVIGSGEPDSTNYLRFLITLYLVLEMICRLLRLIMNRQPSGSLLGYLVKPFYDLLFK